jgi:hypothetical protein
MAEADRRPGATIEPDRRPHHDERGDDDDRVDDERDAGV